MKLPVSIKSGWFVLILLFVFISGSVSASGITIGSGSSISVGSGAIHLGCGDLINNGTVNLGSGVVDVTNNVSNNNQLNGDSGSLRFGGDWSNSGTIAPGTSTVAVVDECGDGSINFDGSSEFYNLSMTTTAGKTIYLESGSEQTIANNLVFTGTAGNFLTLRSSNPGVATFTSLAPGGTQFIDWVDVEDNHANVPFQHIAPDLPGVFNSVDSGGNIRWFQFVPVPALSGLGILLLVALMLFGAAGFRRGILR
jgi:hypothetical protein